MLRKELTVAGRNPGTQPGGPIAGARAHGGGPFAHDKAARPSRSRGGNGRPLRARYSHQGNGKTATTSTTNQNRAVRTLLKRRSGCSSSRVVDMRVSFRLRPGYE